MKPSAEDLDGEQFSPIPVNVECFRRKSDGNLFFRVRRKSGRYDVLDKYCVVEDQGGIPVAIHNDDRVSKNGGVGPRILRLAAYVFSSKAGVPAHVVRELLRLRDRDERARAVVSGAVKKFKGNTSDIRSGIVDLVDEFGSTKVQEIVEDFAEDPEDFAWDVFLEMVDE